MKQGLHPEIRKCLKDDNVEVPKRLLVANVWIFSKVLYLVSTWQRLTKAKFRKFHVSVLKVYSTIL